MLYIMNFLLYYLFLLKRLLLTVVYSGNYAIEHSFRSNMCLKEASALNYDPFPQKFLHYHPNRSI